MKHTFAKRFTALMLAAALAVPVSAATQPVMEVQASRSGPIIRPELTVPAYDDSTSACNAKKIHSTLMKGKGITFQTGSIAVVRSDVKKISGFNVNIPYTSRKRWNGWEGGYIYTISAKDAKAYRNKIRQKEAETRQKKAEIRKGKSSAVSSASADLADQLHKSLRAKKAFSFYTKGDPDKICKNLIPMVQAANRLGVIFKYDTKKMGDGYYKVTISKDNAECYYYATGIMQEVSDGYYVGKDLNEVFADDLADFNADLLDLYNEDLEYAKEMFGDGGAAIEPFKPYTLEEYLDYKFSKACRIVMHADSLNDVSDIVKLWVISDCHMLDGANIKYDEAEGGRYWHGYTDHQVLKELYNYEAIGTCGEFAIADKVLFSWLGIDVKVCEDYGHAWVEGRAANSKGKVYDYKFDYELEVRGTDGLSGEFDKAGGSVEFIN